MTPHMQQESRLQEAITSNNSADRGKNKQFQRFLRIKEEGKLVLLNDSRQVSLSSRKRKVISLSDSESGSDEDIGYGNVTKSPYSKPSGSYKHSSSKLRKTSGYGEVLEASTSPVKAMDLTISSSEDEKEEAAEQVVLLDVPSTPSHHQSLVDVRKEELEPIGSNKLDNKEENTLPRQNLEDKKKWWLNRWPPGITAGAETHWDLSMYVDLSPLIKFPPPSLPPFLSSLLFLIFFSRYLQLICLLCYLGPLRTVTARTAPSSIIRLSITSFV